MAKGKQGFTVFHADVNALASVLSAEQIGRLFIALSVYSETGEASIDDDLKGVFALLAPKIDAQNARYEETCERNRTNRSKNDHSSPVDNQNDHSSPVVTTGQSKRPLVTSRDQQEQEQEQEQELKQEQEHGDIGGEAANAHAHTREALTAENGNCEDDAAEESKRSKKVKQIRHKYGEYSNVLLTDDEYAKLVAEYPDQYSALIERLSSYMASTGKRYKSHLATMRNWVRMDYERGTSRSAPSQRAAPVQHRESTADYYMRMAQSMPDDDGGVSSDGKTGNGDFDPFDF